MLKVLNEAEKNLLQYIVDHMTHRGRRDYAVYLKNDGASLTELEDINLSHDMTSKGWLVRSCDMLELNPVHLTKEAWRRYSLDEWEEIEEEILEKERGDDSGSW